MPPIPVHIDDPITPSKPQGVTPHTQEQQQQSSPNINAPTTTQSASSAYQPARPGAAAVPAPTPYIPRPQPQATPTTPSTAAQNAPPQPQPGAVPIPPSQQAPVHASSTLPPPPKAGERLQQSSIPSQMSIPPPQQNYASTNSTTTSLPQAGPTTVNLGPVAPVQSQAERSVGYQQNAYAQDLTPAQRRSVEQQDWKETVGMGGCGSSSAADSASETAGNMWNTMKDWASTAGEKLAEGERAVWKKFEGR